MKTPPETVARDEVQSEATSEAEPFWSRETKGADAARVISSDGAKLVARSAVRVKLTNGVALVLDGVSMEQLTPDALRALEPATRQLLEALRGAGLIAANSDGAGNQDE
ncbi:MAG: hypothetical protein N2C14_01190 [Planctomycetales bacterium]